MAAYSKFDIEKTPNVCGGEARVRDTRIPVWLLVLKHKLGESAEAVLRSYPALSPESLDAASDYYREHPVEIDRAIWRNDTSANVPMGERVPLSIILDGIRLGLDDSSIREAFDPPLDSETIVAARR